MKEAKIREIARIADEMVGNFISINYVLNAFPELCRCIVGNFILRRTVLMLRSANRDSD